MIAPSWADAWFFTLVEAAIKGVLILGVCAAAAALFRHAPARARHLLWSVTLAPVTSSEAANIISAVSVSWDVSTERSETSADGPPDTSGPAKSQMSRSGSTDAARGSERNSESTSPKPGIAWALKRDSSPPCVSTW